MLIQPRCVIAISILLVSISLHCFADPSPDDRATDQAARLVEKLLAMPTALQDPQGLKNAERWQLVRDIGALGDIAIPVLQANRSRATTALQRQELTAAIAAVHTPAGTKVLMDLIADKDDDIRSAAINGLAERVSSPPDQGGNPDILLLLAKWVSIEKVDLNRQTICSAMRGALKPLPPADKPDDDRKTIAITVLRDRLANDSSADVRFNAACILTEFKDTTGREELKKAARRLAEAHDTTFGLDQLVPAAEFVTGRTFGPVPLNPALASDTRKILELTAQRTEILAKLAEWAKNDP